jgi:hypothetical protein
MQRSSAKPQSPRAPARNWSQLPRILCTAAALHPSLQSAVALQLEQIASRWNGVLRTRLATGNAAEKALLADVTEKNPDASYVELLRLFKVRRSVADEHLKRMVHLVCCALPAHMCSQLPRLILCSVLRCLFVCLFVCLFACLRLALAKHTVDDAAFRRTRVVAR